MLAADYLIIICACLILYQRLLKVFTVIS